MASFCVKVTKPAVLRETDAHTFISYFLSKTEGSANDIRHIIISLHQVEAC
jgi:hypothetical protein